MTHQSDYNVVTDSFPTFQMEAFFEQYPEAGAGEQYREQALETVQTNIRWVEANAQQIGDWLNSRK